MSLIDRYVARTYFSSYLILLLVGIGLYVLFDVLANIDEFTEAGGIPAGRVISLMADFYAHNIPLYFSQLAAPAMAIAAAFTVGVMLRNNELTTLAAAGYPLPRLAAPLIVSSMLLIGLWVANRELLIPRFAEQIARKHDDVIGQVAGGVNCVRDDENTILTALKLYANDGRMQRVIAVRHDPQGAAQDLIEADSATYDPTRGVWRLERGRLMRLDPQDQPSDSPLGEPLRTEPIDELRFSLSPGELLLRQGTQWAELLSLREMSELLASRTLTIRPKIAAARHVRLTQPVLQIILVLLAIPFFLRRVPANVLAAGGRAMLLCGLFFGLAFAVHSMEVDERWVATAAWIPILTFGPIAVFLLSNVET